MWYGMVWYGMIRRRVMLFIPSSYHIILYYIILYRLLYHRNDNCYTERRCGVNQYGIEGERREPS